MSVSSTVSFIIVATLGFCALGSMRLRKDPRQSALTYLADLVAGALVALACCLNAGIVGFEAALRAFRSAAWEEYKARWNHIAAAPGRTEFGAAPYLDAPQSERATIRRIA